MAAEGLRERIVSVVTKVIERPSEVYVRACAAAHGWDADASGPLDEATDRAVRAFLDRAASRGARRFVVGPGPDDLANAATLDMLIEANPDDWCMLAVVGGLEIGETWDPMHGEPVRRIA